MNWNIFYFESARGEKFVKEFIEKQNSAVKAKFIAMIDFLEKYGPFLNVKYTKKIRKDLYELRLTSREQMRILYTVQHRDIILLHAFKKKTSRILHKEIKTAIFRLEALKT